MLSFFRINDPYRLVIILVLLLLIRLPYYLMGVPLQLSELHWRLVGEAMAGGHHLYIDICDNMAPLAGAVYQAIFFLFGNVRWPYYALSVLLVIVQAGLFNQTLLKNKAYRENTYVPGLFYILFMCLSFDFISLPPVLISLTFILMAVHNIFRRIDNTARDEIFLYTGVYLGVAVLFYLPVFPFLLTTLLSLALFTGSTARRIMLLLFGFGVTLAIAYTYYFQIDAAHDFHRQFVASLWATGRQYWVSPIELILTASVPLLVLLVSLFLISSMGSFTNYQVKFQQVMLMNMAAGLMAVFLAREWSPSLLIIFVPAFSFFTTHGVLAIKRKLWAELLSFLIFVAVAGWGYATWQRPGFPDRFLPYSKYFVKETSLPKDLVGQKLWVIGSEESYYQRASPGSKYLNWSLSREKVADLDYYAQIEDIYRSIEAYDPAGIVDIEGLMPRLMQRMPMLSEKYVPVGDGLCYRKKK